MGRRSGNGYGEARARAGERRRGAAVVRTETFLVFATSSDGACKGLSVTAQSPIGFTVQEQTGGTSSGGFSWRVVAKRKDINVQRLAKFSLPNIKIPGVHSSVPIAPSSGPDPLPPKR